MRLNAAHVAHGNLILGFYDLSTVGTQNTKGSIYIGMGPFQKANVTGDLKGPIPAFSSDALRIYAATASGVFVSGDFGQSFANESDGIQAPVMWGVSVGSLGSNIVYAAASDGLYSRSN